MVCRTLSLSGGNRLRAIDAPGRHPAGAERRAECPVVAVSPDPTHGRIVDVAEAAMAVGSRCGLVRQRQVGEHARRHGPGDGHEQRSPDVLGAGAARRARLAEAVVKFLAVRPQRFLRGIEPRPQRLVCARRHRSDHLVGEIGAGHEVEGADDDLAHRQRRVEVRKALDVGDARAQEQVRHVQRGRADETSTWIQSSRGRARRSRKSPSIEPTSTMVVVAPRGRRRSS